MTSHNTNKFGLTERDMATIWKIFEHFPEIQNVYIFGSRAKGTFRYGSDVDLALMDPNISETTILHLKSAFEESSLPYNVDFVNYPTLQHADLKAHIDRVGRPLYEVHPLPK